MTTIRHLGVTSSNFFHGSFTQFDISLALLVLLLHLSISRPLSTHHTGRGSKRSCLRSGLGDWWRKVTTIIYSSYRAGPTVEVGCDPGFGSTSVEMSVDYCLRSSPPTSPPCVDCYTSTNSGAIDKRARTGTDTGM